MEQMTLKDIQQVSFSILKDVHAFCIANDIHYSLAYGTLLGAIRHKGFIPWDDDIDIMMPRPDFEKFFKLYPGKGKFKAAAPGQCDMALGRVYDTELTYADSYVPWVKGNSGIWIDIFPVDSVPDDPEEYKELVSRLNVLLSKQIRRRKLKQPFDQLDAKKKWQKLVNMLHLSESLESVLRQHLDILATLQFGSTQHCSLLSRPWNAMKEYFTYESMTQFTEVDFEDMKAMAVKDYDGVLTRFYGNYMQLPPVEDRVPQQSYIKFYWKNK